MKYTANIFRVWGFPIENGGVYETVCVCVCVPQQFKVYLPLPSASPPTGVWMWS